jgi:hypothetical protein
MGGFDLWLRDRGQLGRNISAWNLDRFRLNSTRLYHGTASGFADEIMAGGIDLSRGRANLDFGQGFYTSMSLTHARTMAGRVARRVGQESSIISYRVSNKQLARLNSLTFEGPNGSWTSFVGLHRTPGTPLHGYDLVSGPAIGNLSTLQALPFPQFNQTSLHSVRAVVVFENGFQRIIP